MGLPDTDADTALAVAKDVQDRFTEAIEGSSVTISMGCAIGAFHRADFLSILKRADEALYASKRLGRNRITLAKGRKPHSSGAHALVAA